jgi:RHS repeat-associated protein
VTDTGIAYDNFGNITTLPSGDAGGNPVTNTYYMDNVLASQNEAGETIEHLLDPAGRARETISSGTTAATVVSHFAGAADRPAWTVDSHGNWTRYITGVGGLTATQTNGGTPVLQLANLHGDVVATAALNESETKLLSTADTTEFGVPRTTPSRYSWLGAAQRATELPNGIVSMGVRAYVPQLGRFEQKDPIQSGSANAYDYSGQDPVNNTDLGGAMYNTPYTPVLDTSGNAIAAGFGVQAVDIYQAALAAAKAHQEAEEAATRASWEAQNWEWLHPQPRPQEGEAPEQVELETGSTEGNQAVAAFDHTWVVWPWVSKALGEAITVSGTDVGAYVLGVVHIPGWVVQGLDHLLHGTLQEFAGNLMLAGDTAAVGTLVSINIFGSVRYGLHTRVTWYSE